VIPDGSGSEFDSAARTEQLQSSSHVTETLLPGVDHSERDVWVNSRCTVGDAGAAEGAPSVRDRREASP
jgi:hypothetical protein